MQATTLIRGKAGRHDWGLLPSADLLASKRLLHVVAGKPELGTVVRVYQPGPTVAFSRKEETLPGFADAVSEALAFGFEPVIRPAGGRMVALDQQWLVLDIVTPEPDRSNSHRDIYESYGDAIIRVLTGLGVDAALGPVPGEYCPGDYSINARGEVKIVGTAQRVTSGARLFSASIPLAISPSVNEMFNRVNKILDLDWNPATLGSLAHEAPGVSYDELEQALIAALVGTPTKECALADIFSAQSSLAA